MTTAETDQYCLYRGEALAPMVRASTTPLRILALRYGADFVYTEELVDRSLIQSVRVENHVLKTIDYVKNVEALSKKSTKKLQKEGRAPVLLRIDPNVEATKLVCQIGSGEPELAVAAALHVRQDVAGIDINMGCPRKFSVSGGMGSALLSDPDRACRIIRALTNALTDSQHGVPVSAKIRLLKDTSSTLDFITGLVNAGVKAVAIHGRRVGDEGTNAADWATLSEVVSLSKAKHQHVSILVNGDFYTRDEFVEFQKKTIADGVLLARPALYNTSIFRKPPVADSTQQYSYTSPLLINKSRVVKDYLELAVRYDIHHKNVKYVICEMMNSRRAPTHRVPFLPQDVYDGQTIAKTCSCHSIQDICRVWNVDYQAHAQRPTAGDHVNRTDPAAPAGDHKYLDSYFLDNSNSETHSKATKRVNEIERLQTKRVCLNALAKHEQHASH